MKRETESVQLSQPKYVKLMLKLDVGISLPAFGGNDLKGQQVCASAYVYVHVCVCEFRL